MSRANEEIARIHWNMVVADEVTFQGRTTTKDKFIHKTGSGLEGYVISWVIFPMAAANCCCIRRIYIIHAQGVEYRWIRDDPSSGFSKVSVNAFGLRCVLY